MVHATLESKLNMGYRQSRYAISSNLYKVVINGEDGEYMEHEVEANSYAEASSQAESLAWDMMNVQYIEVYQIA